MDVLISNHSLEVAPRRYMDLFQLSSERKTKTGKVFNQNEIAAEPRLKRVVFTYLSVEQKVIDELQLPDVPPKKENNDENSFT